MNRQGSLGVSRHSAGVSWPSSGVSIVSRHIAGVSGVSQHSVGFSWVSEGHWGTQLGSIGTQRGLAGVIEDTQLCSASTQRGSAGHSPGVSGG